MSGGGIGSFDRFCSTQVSIAPGTISANTSSEVTVTMPGLLTTDIVLACIKPTLTAGVDLGNFRVSAANTMKITFQNSTGSGVAVPTETYNVYIVRPEKAIGGPDALSGGSVIFN